MSLHIIASGPTKATRVGPVCFAWGLFPSNSMAPKDVLRRAQTQCSTVKRTFASRKLYKRALLKTQDKTLRIEFQRAFAAALYYVIINNIALYIIHFYYIIAIYSLIFHHINVIYHKCMILHYLILFYFHIILQCRPRLMAVELSTSGMPDGEPPKHRDGAILYDRNSLEVVADSTSSGLKTDCLIVQLVPGRRCKLHPAHAPLHRACFELFVLLLHVPLVCFCMPFF